MLSSVKALWLHSLVLLLPKVSRKRRLAPYSRTGLTRQASQMLPSTGQQYQLRDTH